MIRGFVSGLVWGGVVAAAGLSVLSQVVPLPQGAVRPAAAPVSADAAPPATPPVAAIEAPATEPVKEPAVPPASDAAGASGQSASDAAPAESATADGVAKPAAPAPAEAKPETPLAAAPDLQPETAPAVAPEAVAPVVPDVTTPQIAPEAGDLPRVAPLPSVPPLVAEPAPDAAEPPPAPALADPLLQKAPDAPRVGQAAAPPAPLPRRIEPDGKPLTELPDPAAPAAPEAAATAATPLDLFARPFDNPDAKPLFSVILIDDGAADTDRETLAALPFAVTFVIDPLAPGAPEAAAIYRKGGQEVMMTTDTVPQGATAADLEQTYQALDLALPDAVAFLGVAGLAANGQDIAGTAVPIIASQGRGVVTMERGLNAVDQVAEREGLPHATVFRILDAQGESVPVIRRYLDRAAFRAMQEGSVIVLGSTRPDTIAALLQWTVEGRAASVALAPISAVLRRKD